jgi:hypothetical protein
MLHLFLKSLTQLLHISKIMFGVRRTLSTVYGGYIADDIRHTGSNCNENSRRHLKVFLSVFRKSRAPRTANGAALRTRLNSR